MIVSAESPAKADTGMKKAISAWPLPLSVAQHSLTVLALARAASPTGLAPHAELRELLHDADEGLLGFDAISVIKPFLGDGFHALAGRLQDVVFQRYALPFWTPEEKVAHKRAEVGRYALLTRLGEGGRPCALVCAS